MYKIYVPLIYTVTVAWRVGLVVELLRYLPKGPVFNADTVHVDKCVPLSSSERLADNSIQCSTLSIDRCIQQP